METECFSLGYPQTLDVRSENESEVGKENWGSSKAREEQRQEYVAPKS